MREQTKVVPREPTEAMIKAAANGDFHSDSGSIGEVYANIYRVMFDAAPSSPPPVEGELAREALEMACSLIQEAKGVEGPSGGPITDHLDAAEGWLDKIDIEALATRPDPLPAEKLAELRVGQAAQYAPDGDGHRFRVTIVANVEGWFDVRFSDGTTAIVRPSRLLALADGSGR